jgi:hypothetical protein
VCRRSSTRFGGAPSSLEEGGGRAAWRCAQLLRSDGGLTLSLAGVFDRPEGSDRTVQGFGLSRPDRQVDRGASPLTVVAGVFGMCGIMPVPER